MPRIVNLWPQTGHFPTRWKTALVNPLLNNVGLDPIFIRFRPVGNWQVLSKLVEHAEAHQIHKRMS